MKLDPMEKLYKCRYCRNIYTREAQARKQKMICYYHPKPQKLKFIGRVIDIIQEIKKPR